MSRRLRIQVTCYCLHLRFKRLRHFNFEAFKHLQASYLWDIDPKWMSAPVRSVFDLKMSF